MAAIVITIKTDGAAFETCKAEEVACVLRNLADDFERLGLIPCVTDDNGDTIGKVEVID